MPIIDFSQYAYYPALTSTEAERIAYDKLSVGDKESVVPIFELSHRRNASSLGEPASVIQETTGKNLFILDVNQHPAPPPRRPRDPSDDDIAKFVDETGRQAAYNADLARILSPSNGFSAWRELVSTFPNAIPSIVYTDAATQQKNILKQAAFLSKNDTCLAIRVQPGNYEALLPVISQILSILPSEDRLLIILDCGQVRQRSRRQKAIAFIQDAAAKILEEIEIPSKPLARLVCMSNSYPKFDHGKLEKFESYDWEIWRAGRDVCPILFGDYAAQYRLAPSSFIPSGKSTVVFPLSEAWLVYRDINTGDSAGWVAGSKEVIKHALYDKTVFAWGHDVIKSASKGNLMGVEFARYWHAAKINLHIHRQIHLAAANIADYGDDPD